MERPSQNRGDKEDRVAPKARVDAVDAGDDEEFDMDVVDEEVGDNGDDGEAAKVESVGMALEDFEISGGGRGLAALIESVGLLRE